MSATSKLTLLMELKNKLFNEKLMQTKRKFTKVKDKMMGGARGLKLSFMSAFTSMRNEIPLFGRAMDLLGNPYALVIAGVIALTAVLGKGFIEAKKFNHEFLQIKQLNLDKSSQQLGRYKESIRDAAFEVGTNLQDSTKAFYDLQSATGVYGNDAVSIFKKVGRYSIATGAQLGDSMNATTKAMKAFGLSVNDIDTFLVSNAKTVQVGITTFDELARVQTEFAGAAAGAGQSVDTANKIFAAFTSIAKDSNTAATMTKSAFEGLTQTNTVKGLKSIGVSLYDANGNMRDLGNVLTDVSAKFKTMNPKQIDELINKIGGPEGLRNLFVKLKTGADDFHNTLKAFDSSKYDLGAALRNAQGDVTVLSGIVRNRFNTAMSKLGELILPTVARGLNFINKLITGGYEAYKSFIKWLNGGTLGAEIFKGTMIGLAAAITLNHLPLAIMAAKIVLVKGLTTIWTGVQWLLNAALTANPIGLIIVAIGALIGAIVYVVKKTEGWGKSWQAMKKIFTIVWDQIKAHFWFMVDEIVHRIDVLKLRFKQLKEFLQGLFKNIGKAFSLALSGDFSGAKKALTAKIESASAKEIEALKKQRAIARKEYAKQTIDNAKAVIEASKGISIKWKKGNPKGETDTGDGLLSGGLLGDSSTSEGDSNDDSLGQTAGAQLNNVGDKASGPRSIVVNIDAFNKGGINTSNTTLSKMSTEEIESWFRETALRTIRAIELSHG